MTAASWLARARDRARLRYDPLRRLVAAADRAALFDLVATRDDLPDLLDACANAAALDLFRRAMLSIGAEDLALRAARRRYAVAPDATALAHLTTDLVWMRQAPAARAVLDAADPKFRSDPKVLIAAELLLTQEGRLAEAQATARALEGTTGFDPAVSAARRAEAAAARGRYDEALKITRSATARWPAAYGLAPTHARMRFLNGEVEPALAAARAAAEEAAADRAGMAALEVEILMEAGRAHGALNRIQALLADDPTLWPLYSSAFQAAAAAGRMGEFDALAAAAADVGARDAEGLSTLAAHASAQGRAAAAERHVAGVRRLSEARALELALRVAAEAPDGTPAQARAAYEAVDASVFQLDGATLSWATHLFYHDGGAAAVKEALTLVAGVIDRNRHSPGALLLHMRLLIANRRFEDARAELSRLPAGLRRGKAFQIIEAYFDARAGHDVAAAKSWARILDTCFDPASSAAAAHPETVALKWRPRANDILLFCVIYNGAEYVAWLLDYYRRLGVDHFFITDNGSTDGTFQHLARQDDVSLFQCLDSFAQAGCGVAWNNHNIRRFGVGHWCLHVDMDEALVFPGMDAGRDLRALTRYLDAQRYGCVRSVMLDIFPDKLAPTWAADAFAGSRWIDPELHRFPSELPPYESVYGGGPRARLSNHRVLLSKAPLVKATPDTLYLATNHTMTHTRVADLSTALLHYKFVGDFAARVREAVDRKEHFLGAAHYRSLQAGVVGSSASLKGPDSVKYEGPQQLVELGVIDDSDVWRSREW